MTLPDSPNALDVSGLREKIRGTVIIPSDEGYDAARAIWNGNINRRPRLFVKVADAADVVTALNFARDSELEVSVRGGGHNYAGFALSDGGLTIDLSNLTAVEVDVEHQRAACGGGTTWEQLDAGCQAHGLAVPGGFISHTGVAGLTLGGGIGWLSRLAGLSCDNLVGAELVTADGRIVHVSADEDPELLWGLRGGGGNFGIVTRFEFQAHPVGPMLNLGLFFWPLDKGREVLQFAREYARTTPDDAPVFIAGLSAPPEPFVPAEFQFMPGYAMLVGCFGDAERHAELIAPISTAVPPLFQFVTPIPFVALQQMFNAAAPWGIHAYEKAVNLDEMTDPVIDVILEHMPKKRSPLSIVPIFTMGGAYSRIPEESAAFSGSRSMRYVINIEAATPTGEELGPEREWVRNFWDALVPHASGIGGYVNFMSEYEENRVRAAYGPAKYERLVALKQKYDPDNVFHLNQNIRP